MLKKPANESFQVQFVPVQDYAPNFAEKLNGAADMFSGTSK